MSLVDGASILVFVRILLLLPDLIWMPKLAALLVDPTWAAGLFLGFALSQTQDPC